MSILSNKIFQIFVVLVTLGLFIVGITIVTSAQENSSTQTEAKSQSRQMPVMKEYKNIKIGMTGSEVKEMLGKPKVEDLDGFFYLISEEEQMQIGLDEDKKVSVIVVLYSDRNGNAPTYQDVFGTDSANAGQSDGSIYNLLRFAEEGFWIAYHRTVGDEPSVTITIQKMQNKS